jgi:hypothetical protein
MSVFCPFFWFVLLGLVGFEQLDRVKTAINKYQVQSSS